MEQGVTGIKALFSVIALCGGGLVGGGGRAEHSGRYPKIQHIKLGHDMIRFLTLLAMLSLAGAVGAQTAMTSVEPLQARYVRGLRRRRFADRHRPAG